MINKLYILTLFILFSFSQVSCTKYLDKKPDKALAVPSTLQDFQLLLDHYIEINTNSYPALSEVLADNYYMTTTSWNGLLEDYLRNLYIWKEDNQTGNNWLTAYKQILTFNIVLDNIIKVDYNARNKQQWESIKGSALFLRAYYFHSISQLYAQPYEKGSSNEGLGIVLRLNSDINEKSTRASVKDTYERMIMDLKEASNLLPITPLLKSRPSQPAAYGALARVYLSMQEYDSAGVYAAKCLSLYDSLMVYNTELNLTSNTPFKRFNKEVIFQMRSNLQACIAPTRAKIDTLLYNSYHGDDLRKTVFFLKNTDGSYRFKGDYDGGGSSLSNYVFGGIVTDEMYLIVAESLSRAGKTVEAMQYLNKLLESRWKKNLFIPLTATDANEALAKILMERRKELIFRGTRWTDLRRLRNESSLSTTPKRIIDGKTHELPPNSIRYTLRIPIEVINTSGIQQNP